ncbi:PREDICTED: protein trapped in endoderm-1-like [Priapulus caudatus]|uniref:Protein trapped in endoderm-1-like n=1 Tax=Priapulus caudatus TaxID=37621 RepID=A0ABM1F380_PRICU|nr:PREDICTED: protein trapped in endoderm-1-like [Priapulus caudatus]
MTTAAAVTVSMETTDMAAELANVTAATMYVYPAALSNFAATMACAFVVLGCLGNGTTIVALLASEKLRSHATTMFVISLAVTDFIYCVFNMPLTASRYIHMAWVHSDELCMIFPFLFYGNVAVSILNLLTITINRYVLICHTKTYQRIYRQPYIAFMIVASWLVPVVFLVPPLFGVWGRYGEKPQTSSCTILEDENGNSPKSAIFAVGIGVPMIVIVLCYLRIYWQMQADQVAARSIIIHL